MNKIVPDSALILKERALHSVALPVVDADASERQAFQNDDLIVESLLNPVLRQLDRPPSSIFYFAIGADRSVLAGSANLFYRKHAARGVLVAADTRRAQQLRVAHPQDQVIEAAVSARPDAPGEHGVAAVIFINTLLARYADRQIDYLSIDAEDAEFGLLEAMNFSKYRPYFIRCTPDDQPGAAGKVGALLATKGYFSIARTDASLVFADRALLAGNRRTIRSFDVFDTLIARYCIEPRLIFDRVEQLTRHIGFAADRLSAEQRVSNGAYNLNDIYRELAKARGWSKAEQDAAQAAEIFVELEAVIPIAENLARVRDGDIAVSDMYLPEEVIRMLLKKAGLAKEIGIVVSSHGKRSGEIWPALLANYQIEQHLGDNHVADVQSPERFGITSRLTGVSSPDSIESWLTKNGVRDLAQIIRQSRLSTWHENPTVRQLQLIQSRFNFPILLLSSILLARFAAAGNIQNVLFCSRDCNLWLELFGVIKGQLNVSAKESYFYTSRQARMTSSASYRRYASELMQGSGVLVDVCGTGWSLSHMLENLGSRAPLFFIHQLPKMDEYERIRPTPQGMAMSSVIDAQAPGVNNVFLEMCNYADHPQVVDVSYIHQAPHPVFNLERRSEFMLNMVAEQRNNFRQTVAICKAQGLGDVLHVPDDRLRAMVLELYKSLCTQLTLPMIYQSMHAEDEIDQVRQLKKLSFKKPF
jgi:hypothetical protein